GRAVAPLAWQVVGQRLVHCQAQTRVVRRNRAAMLGGDRQLANQLGEDLAPLGVLTPLAVLDIGPFGMTSHNSLHLFHMKLQGATNRRPHNEEAWKTRLLVQAYSALGCSRRRMCSSRSDLPSTTPGAWVMTQAALWVFGKAITSRIDCAPVISITRRSRPKARPPWGGAPYFSASSRKPNFSCCSSSLMPSTRNTVCCMALSWIRIEPPPSSVPLSTMS